MRGAAQIWLAAVAEIERPRLRATGTDADRRLLQGAGLRRRRARRSHGRALHGHDRSSLCCGAAYADPVSSW